MLGASFESLEISEADSTENSDMSMMTDVMDEDTVSPLDDDDNEPQKPPLR